MNKIALVGDNIYGLAHIIESIPPAMIYAEGYISSGSPNVIINGKPAVRVGDITDETDSIHISVVHGKIISGSSKVFINKKPAAYALDKMELHSGMIGDIISGGSTNVNIK